MNRNFPTKGESEHEQPMAGKLLVENSGLLFQLSRHGMVSLHEDPSHGNFYLYVAEPSDRPGPFAEALKRTGKRFFKLCSSEMCDGESRHIDGVIFSDSTRIERGADDSFEGYMSSLGVQYVATTESPGKPDLHRRVLCNASWIETMVNFTAVRESDPGEEEA